MRTVNPLPIRRDPWTRDGEKLWPRATQSLLLGIGAVLAAGTFLVIMTMPDLAYHPARDAELVASYNAYKDTGVPLIQKVGDGDAAYYTKAAGDDDPGSYLIAAYMSHITHSASPYPGLRVAMALLAALPLLLLPTAIARVYRRSRAGFAMLLLPPATWLVNHGTVLIGTEYGLADGTSTLRVYALYGLASSMIFASLVLIAYLTTRRLSPVSLIGWTVVIAGLAVTANLMRSMAGVGIALAVAVLWWINHEHQPKWSRGLLAVIPTTWAVVCAMIVPSMVVSVIDDRRDKIISPAAAALPSVHGLWHPFYLGLAYPNPITPTPGKWGVVWDDAFAWNKALAIDPNVVVKSEEYDAIIKDLYFDIVKEDPGGVAWLYVDKTLFTVKHFAAMLVVILLGIGLAWRRLGAGRARVARVIALATPTVLIGLLPPVLVMPLLYYYVELSAALGLLTALGLGGLVWAYVSLPSHVRAAERRRLTERGILTPDEASLSLSAIVPTRNGVAVLADTLEQLGQRLGADDEIVVVENGSTDGTGKLLSDIRAAWNHDTELVVTESQAGLGNALRTGVLASSGRRLLLSADDLPFGFSDFEAFNTLPDDVILAIGSKAHPASNAARSRRRTIQSRMFRLLREAVLHSSVGDSQGTIWVDGTWARLFANMSREQGLMWNVELVLAAEQQGHHVWEVPVTLAESHDAAPSRFRFRDARIAAREILRLAAQKDDYAEDDWSMILASPAAARRSNEPALTH